MNQSKTTVPNPSTPKSPSATSDARTVRQAELEAGCFDMLCKLEFTLSEMHEIPKEDQHEFSHQYARKMLSAMDEFAQKTFDGDARETILTEVRRVSSASDVYETLLDHRSWGSVIRRTLGATKSSDGVLEDAHRQIFRSLKRTIVTILFHAIQSAGFDTPLGKQLDQSTVIFVKELEKF